MARDRSSPRTLGDCGLPVGSAGCGLATTNLRSPSCPKKHRFQPYAPGNPDRFMHHLLPGFCMCDRRDRVRQNQDYCGEDQQHDPNTSLLAVRNSPRRAAQAGPGNPIVSRMPLRPMQASLVKATSIIAGYNAAACPAPVRDRPPELIERMAWSSAKHPRMLNGRSPRV